MMAGEIVAATIVICIVVVAARQVLQERAVTRSWKFHDDWKKLWDDHPGWPS